MIREVTQKILNGWVAAKREPFSDNEVAQWIRQDLKDSVQRVISNKYPTFEIKASAGAGNWADIPWLSILDPNITKTTQDGIYPVYLFCSDGSGFYLSLNQGTTSPKEIYGKKASEVRAQEIGKILIEKIPALHEWGKESINLRANTALGKSYELPNIAAKYYPADNLPSDEELTRDLLSLLEIYEQIRQIWRNDIKDRSLLTDNLESNEQRESDSEKLVQISTTTLPKSFILLAGISGTGKSRFVRQQAESHKIRKNIKSFCLIPVRPDWHEPSDLLGYLSHINGSKYVVTDLLFFIVSAWKNSALSVDASGIKLKDLKEIVPFWLCLDEMNLAPVEQYFADFLSVLETRQWTNDGYSTEAILKSEVLKKVADKEKLREDLGLVDEGDKALFDHFYKYGISLPPNLIVAGTVNMDETTHGFSRKVIDRALTIDFGCFFPNDFDHYFDAKTRNKALSFPLHSSVSKEELKEVVADSDGQKSIHFLNEINKVLKDTPFELAFRALSELLISVVCFNPTNDKELQAVWDDFLMTKVLPRIDGDTEKLRGKTGAANLLDDLSKIAKTYLSEIWDSQRPDLLRENVDDTPLNIDCHSKKKIAWMSDRLAKNSFTSFWP